MRKPFTFIRGFLIFFVFSHVASYFVSGLQTVRILAEIRKLANKR